MVESNTMNGSSNGAETREKGEGQSFGPALNKTAPKLFTDTETEPEFLAVSAVAEISKLMTELTSARNYLTAETERIRTETARLNNLSKSALASVDLISENLSKWNAKKEAA